MMADPRGVAETTSTEALAAPAEGSVGGSPAGPGPMAAPAFSERDVAQFGRDDSLAVAIISRMLTGFFFYSLLVMLVVAWWTWRVYRPGPAPTGASTAESAAP